MRESLLLNVHVGAVIILFSVYSLSVKCGAVKQGKISFYVQQE